jgi:tRNA(Arg) A34 adenosine deaminase TadA
MDEALRLATLAAAAGEVPVGAVITDPAGHIIATAANQVEQQADPSAHAELLALRQAGRAYGRKYLAGCTLTVTLEPCAMCAGAIAAYRIKTLVFGAYDPKSGAVEHGPQVFAHATTHHKPEVIGGVRNTDCSALLQTFFAELRNAPSDP